MESFTVSKTFPVSKETIYNAWLDSADHTNMTGGEARCSAETDGSFTAWDGYIWGKNIELVDGSKIVQDWRTSDFEDADADSRIEVTFHDAEGGCEVKLHHTNIPDNHPSNYETGWFDHYFDPMTAYFGS